MAINIQDIQNFCEEFFIPEDYLMEILQDSKVLPMIRGKVSEYNAYLFLKNNLDSHTFDVQKLNLNAQPNEYDEDVSITHRSTGIRLKVEVKNAVRESFSVGGTRKKYDEPYFMVKCHRSRSNIKLATTTNDRYLPGDFDLVMSTPLNAIYAGKTFETEMQLIENLDIIKKFYNVQNNVDLQKKCNNDWRFAFPEDIAENCNGISAIPRTPYVKLRGRDKWFTIDKLGQKLNDKAIKMKQNPNYYTVL